MIYLIYNFDDGPHWNAALVEADSTEAATAVLQAELVRDEDDCYPATVWAPLSPEHWIIREAEGPLLFLLGSGCR